MVNNSCNIPNKTIIHKDNLESLKKINSKCIDLIYLDPPFKKNETWEAKSKASREKIDKIKQWFKLQQMGGGISRYRF